LFKNNFLFAKLGKINSILGKNKEYLIENK